MKGLIIPNWFPFLGILSVILINAIFIIVWFKKNYKPEVIAVAIGAFIAFILPAATKIVLHYINIKKTKNIICDELDAIKRQIPQKQVIIMQIISGYKMGHSLSGLSVRMMTSGYNKNILNIYNSYTRTERECLHVIYERIRISDDVLDSIENDYLKIKRENIIQNPEEMVIKRLEALNSSFELITKLISDFQKGVAVEVFPDSFKLTNNISQGFEKK